MTEELEFETYLRITKKNFGIYLFDKKKSINLYEEEMEFDREIRNIDYKLLPKFLENNIFKIEKLIGKFIKNIIVIIENEKIFFVDIGIKKKSYEKKIDKIYLENILTEAKDIIKETIHQQKIIHMLITKYIIDGNYSSKFTGAIECDNLCLELKFISIPNNVILEIEKILEYYQIKVSNCLDCNYIENFFKNSHISLSEMGHKIQSGANENEVLIVPKNLKKLGFFEKFFQLFS